MKLLSILSVLSSVTLLHANIERGQELYSQVCFHCHGQELEGGKGPALTDEYWRHGSSPEAIMKVINKGIKDTEMIGYEAVFPENDRQALLDFVLSKQTGVRNLVMEQYVNQRFQGQEFTPELFAAQEASGEKAVPENTFFVAHDFTGGIRYTGLLYAWQEGDYDFNLNSPGRTHVYVNGELVNKSGDDYPQPERVIKPIKLTKGAHNLEIIHESKRKHGHRIGGSYGVVKGKRITFQGRSLQGNTPKFVIADPMKAKVVRKWIRDLSPRALLCLLPNNVIVAYIPGEGRVERAWHSARINQTPSLPDRSAAPSEMVGVEIKELTQAPAPADKVSFLGYEVDGKSVLIRTKVGEQEQTVKITPEGANAYTISH